MPVSALDGANVAKTLVRVIVEEFADVVLHPREMHSFKVDGTYVVVDGLHIAPKCTNCPPGPHPTRKDRPMARPASMYAPSLSFAMEDVIPTRAYFRVGLNICGSTSWPNEARFVKEIRVDEETLIGNTPRESLFSDHRRPSHGCASGSQICPVQGLEFSSVHS